MTTVSALVLKNTAPGLSDNCGSVSEIHSTSHCSNGRVNDGSEVLCTTIKLLVVIEALCKVELFVIV